jgi:hypothetical protein
LKGHADSGILIAKKRGEPMATKKRTSVLLNEELLRKARKTLKAASNTEAITKALQETLMNREIEASLKDLLRKGRGRFVDIYQ